MLGNLLYTIKQCHSADVQRKKMLVQVNMIGSSEFSDFSYKLVSTLVQFREEFLDLNFNSLSGSPAISGGSHSTLFCLFLKQFGVAELGIDSFKSPKYFTSVLHHFFNFVEYKVEGSPYFCRHHSNDLPTTTDSFILILKSFSPWTAIHHLS